MGATKVLLVTMAGYPLTPSAFLPDNGLAQLAACLLAAGHDVEVLDLNTPTLVERLYPSALRAKLRPAIEAQLAGRGAAAGGYSELRRLEAELGAHRDEAFASLGRDLAVHARVIGARLVGCKLWNGDGYTGTVALAAALKAAAPELPVVAGGPQVDFFQELVGELKSPFDAWSIGEGEPTILALADAVARGADWADVPNLILRRGGRVVRTRVERVRDLHTLPTPTYDPAVYPAATAPQKLRMGVVEESRGCPFTCAFCNHPLKAGAGLRVKRPDAVADELAQMRDRYGVGACKLGGSYTPSRYMRRLAGALIERKVGVDLCAYGRISDAREADFALYHRAGVRSLFFGVETGSQAILDDKIDKGYQAPDARTVLRASREAGIFTIASLVYPNPGETAESRQATLDLVREARPDGVPIHFPVLLPGSRWWAEPAKYGFAVEDRAACLRAMIGYKARLLFPPRYWPALPYTVDGKPFAVYAEETAAMTREIEALGPVTLLSDDAAVVALHSGLDARAFRDRFRWLAATGDAEGLQGLIDRVNVSLAERAATSRRDAAGAPHGAAAPRGREAGDGQRSRVG